jgi:hypothetical protein
MNEQPSNPFSGLDMFTRMWSDFGEKMMRNGMAFPPTQNAPEAAREMRNTMFKAWSDYCDQFMRSQEFLEMMQQSLSASVTARKQLNEFLGQVQHEMQSVSRQDVDQIMLALRHMERRMVDGMERLSEQLDALDRRLEKLERKSNGNKRGKKPSGNAAKEAES